MSTPNWFEDQPVLGGMSAAEATAKLRELGEFLSEPMPDPAVSFAVFDWLPWRDRLWAHTTHAFGYLGQSPPGPEPRPIVHAGNIDADPALKNARVRITLDRLQIGQYPGGGIHHILFDFYAHNQTDGGVEPLHFNAAYRAREGESVAAIGYPIFVGLRVGPDGLGFRCRTVNIKNEQDGSLLGFLDTDAFRAGLRLVAGAQPALLPLSTVGEHLTRSMADRARNVPVQDFAMGLDFGSTATGARLAEGSYLAVQVPDSSLDWSRWVYDPNSGQVVSATDRSQRLPFNYMVIGVSRYDGS